MSKGLTHTTGGRGIRDGGSRQYVNRVRAGWLVALILALLVPARMSTVSGCDLMREDDASAAASSRDEEGARSAGLRISSLIELVWAPLDLPSKIGGITTSSARHWWSTRSGAEKGLILEGLARAVAVGAAVVSAAFDEGGAPETPESTVEASHTDRGDDEAASPAEETAEESRVSEVPAPSSGEQPLSPCQSSDSI